MKTLRIGFSTGRGFKVYSLLIRVLTGSRVSHTYQRIEVPEFDSEVIFQASGLKVNYENADIFASHSRVVEEYEVPVSDFYAHLAERMRVTEVGKPYGILQVVGYMWVLLLRRVGLRVKNPLADGNASHVCVELNAKQIGLKDVEGMTPEDLRQWCAANADRVV